MSMAKILAVDDEPDFELLLTQRFRRQIRENQFAFRFAGNGEEALEMLAAEPDWMAEVMRFWISLALTISRLSLMPSAFWHSWVILPFNS